jgi:hypothetical protein
LSSILKQMKRIGTSVHDVHEYLSKVIDCSFRQYKRAKGPTQGARWRALKSPRGEAQGTEGVRFSEKGGSKPSQRLPRFFATPFLICWEKWLVLHHPSLADAGGTSQIRPHTPKAKNPTREYLRILLQWGMVLV